MNEFCDPHSRSARQIQGDLRPKSQEKSKTVCDLCAATTEVEGSPASKLSFPFCWDFTPANNRKEAKSHLRKASAIACIEDEDQKEFSQAAVNLITQSFPFHYGNPVEAAQ